jgi:hypothetical protein
MPLQLRCEYDERSINSNGATYKYAENNHATILPETLFLLVLDAFNLNHLIAVYFNYLQRR